MKKRFWTLSCSTLLFAIILSVSHEAAGESKLESLGRKVTLPDCWQDVCPHCECSTTIAKRKITHPLYAKVQSNCSRMHYWCASVFHKNTTCNNCR